MIFIQNFMHSNQKLLHILTAGVKFLLLSNKLILIIVMYCKFVFCFINGKYK